MSKKRQLGQYFTKNISRIINRPEFDDFLKDGNGLNTVSINGDYKVCNIIDPFAGDGSLLRSIVDRIRHIECNDSEKYRIHAIGCDIDKTLCEQYGWKHIDSILATDKEIEYSLNINPYFLCVTNPPYLGKSSAKRLGIKNVKNYFKNFDDLYLESLYKCYRYYLSGIMIVPESFISYLLNTKLSPQYTELYSINKIIVVYDKLFEDTDVPVCVITWDKTSWCPEDNKLNNYAHITIDTIPDASISIKELRKIREQYTNNPAIDNIKQNIKFNDPNGSIGLVAYDSYIANKKPIQFCSIDKLPFDKNTVSKESRMNTIISIPAIYNDLVPNIIDFSNYILNDIIRKQTYDLVLTPFKCNNTNGLRRRRLDYDLAKSIIATAIYELTPH